MELVPEEPSLWRGGSGDDAAVRSFMMMTFGAHAQAATGEMSSLQHDRACADTYVYA
jgi:hypothetical protein